MRLRKQAAILVTAVVATAVIAVGVTAAVTAGASTGATTYFGCLRSGKLLDVGVSAPTCPASASPISWNSQGSAGPTGPQGPAGQASVVNVPAASLFAGPCPQPPGPTGSSGGSSSGVAAFLDIPGIPGESTDSNHTGQIDVRSWSWGLAGSASGASCSASRSAAGQGASGQEFSIVKNVDKSSPQFMLYSSLGTHFATATLSLRKAGASQDYLTFTFSNVFVEKIQWVHDGSDVPSEEVTFLYTKVAVSYAQQNSDGSFASPIQTCFDINLQQAC